MAGDRISSKTQVSTHTRLSAAHQLPSPATAGKQTCLMLFLAPELHVSMRKPLNANWEDCAWLMPLNNSLWGATCALPSVLRRVHVWRWDMLSSKPVRTCTWPFQPVLFFCVIGRYNGAFSRWFPAGLHMTCDNITVLKGQAWREAVGVAEAGLRLSKPRLHSSAPTVMCLVFRGNALLLIFKYLVFNTLPKRQCQYLQYELNLDSLCCRCREGVALLACW